MTEQCGTNMGEYPKEVTCPCGCGSKFYAHHPDGGCHCEDNLLFLADEAWKEVLKEKIKEKIIAKKGEHLDKLAEIIATANGAKWKNKMSAKKKRHEFKDELKDFFSSSCE